MATTQAVRSCLSDRHHIVEDGSSDSLQAEATNIKMSIMKRRKNTPEYWISLVEQHLKLGNQFALIPADSLPQETAIALAERLDVVLEKWDTDYVFHQKAEVELKKGKGQVLH